MKRIIKLIFLSVFSFCGNLFAQDFRPLRIAEKVPDIFLGKFLNEPLKKQKISDWKGKLIILDFWGTHCHICISGMPEMDSLQKEFNDRIQIIYITKNSEAEVNKLFSKIGIKKPDAPFIVNDTVFNKLFPHTGDPFHVWIDQKGNVYAITQYYNSNENTIRKFLSGDDPHLTRRWDFGLNQNFPLVSEQNSALLELTKSYSALFKGLEEYNGTIGLITQKDSVSGKTVGLTLCNASLLMLYNVSYNTDLFGMQISYFNLSKNNRILLEVKDPDAFFPPDENSKLAGWIRENQYGYEIKVPPENAKEIYEWMQDDLKRYLPYNAVIEKKKVKCLVLSDIQKENKDNGGTKPEGISSGITYNKDNSISFQNYPVPDFVRLLIYNNVLTSMPLINESKLNRIAFMHICSKLEDIKSLENELPLYGFTLQEKEMEINMLVIRDKR